MMHIAKDLGIEPSVLRRWVTQERGGVVELADEQVAPPVPVEQQRALQGRLGLEASDEIPLIGSVGRRGGEKRQRQDRQGKAAHGRLREGDARKHKPGPSVRYNRRGICPFHRLADSYCTSVGVMLDIMGAPADSFIGRDEEVEVENASTMRKQELMFATLKQLAAKDIEITGIGVPRDPVR